MKGKIPARLLFYNTKDKIKKTFSMESEMKDKKQFAVNMFARLVSFVVTMGISFFVTPYIVNNVGKEAYGFVSLGNNFVSYAQILTIALNSMAGRFLAMKLYNNDQEGLNKTFTSVIFANTLMACILLLPSILILVFLEHLVNIPGEIVTSVKLLWGFIFLDFDLSIIFGTFSNATYLRNRLDLSSKVKIVSDIMRGVLLIGLFFFFGPKLWFIGLVSVLCTIYAFSRHIRFTRKLLPQVKIKASYIDFYSIKEIFLSGVWSSITRLSQILESGLDLLITNIMIDSSHMGTLSIAKTVPNFIVTFITTISDVFCPQILISYAKGKIDEVVDTVKLSMKINSITSSIPNAILIVFGSSFFALWVPNQDVHMLQILSILTVINTCLSGPLQSVYFLFTVTNKLKTSSKAMIVLGISSFSLTFLTVKFTGLGVYAVAGVSTMCSIVISLAFHLPVGAKIIGRKWWTFFPEAIKCVINVSVVCVIGLVMHSLIKADSWFTLILAVGLTAVIGGSLCLFVTTNKDERRSLVTAIKNKRRR